MRLGVLVHSVLVVLDEMTLACFELLGTPFLCQEPVAFNFAIHTISVQTINLLPSFSPFGTLIFSDCGVRQHRSIWIAKGRGRG